MVLDKSIIIPVADIAPKSQELLEGLMLSIDSQELYKAYNIIICFDVCKEEFKEYFISKYPYIYEIFNEGKRLRFSGNANLGLRYAHKELNSSVFLVNQDTVLPSLKYMENIEGEGLSTPQQVTLFENTPATLDDIKLLNEKQMENYKDRQKHTKITGFCLWINKQVMDKIGYLDEYFTEGMDDDMICAKALLAGFPIEATGTSVHHYISKAGSEYQPRLNWLFQMFKYRFQIPNNIEHKDCNQWILENHCWNDSMKYE